MKGFGRITTIAAPLAARYICSAAWERQLFFLVIFPPACSDYPPTRFPRLMHNYFIRRPSYIGWSTWRHSNSYLPHKRNLHSYTSLFSSIFAIIFRKTAPGFKPRLLITPLCVLSKSILCNLISELSNILASKCYCLVRIGPCGGGEGWRCALFGLFSIKSSQREHNLAHL